MTLFAPPNAALQPPKRGPGHRCVGSSVDLETFELCILNEYEASDSLEALSVLEGLVDEDPQDGHKKETIKRILSAILSYHILPHSLYSADLAKNTTFGTSYTPKDGAFDEKPLRVRVEKRFKFLHSFLLVNLYARVVKPDIQATNGTLHICETPSTTDFCDF